MAFRAGSLTRPLQVDRHGVLEGIIEPQRIGAAIVNGTDSVAVGHDIYTGPASVAVGRNIWPDSTIGEKGVYIGNGVGHAGDEGVAVGHAAATAENGVAVGAGASAGIGALALGKGVTAATNETVIGASTVTQVIVRGIPGPYANKTLAGIGGVPQYGLFHDADGVVYWMDTPPVI